MKKRFKRRNSVLIRKPHLIGSMFGTIDSSCKDQTDSPPSLLASFLAIHIYKDLNADVAAWYFHSTPVWLIVMTVASAVYALEFNRLRRAGVDTLALFRQLPPG